MQSHTIRTNEFILPPTGLAPVDFGLVHVRLDRITNADLVAMTALAGEHADGREAIRTEFQRLAAQWREEAGMYSLEWQQAMHPAYQTIMAKGPCVIPFVLEDLSETRGLWFWALRYLNGGVDVAAKAGKHRDKVRAWLRWGQMLGYIDEHGHAR
jgi:hypothetical protein